MNRSPPIQNMEKEIATLKAAYDRLYDETRQGAAADMEEEGRLMGEERRRGRMEGEQVLRVEVPRVERTTGGSGGPASYCPSFLRHKKPSPLPPKRPSSRFLRLDLQRETFEGAES